MCNVKFSVLFLALVLSSNAATITEEDSPAQEQADDNSQYLEVSSTRRASLNSEYNMGIYSLQETRVNGFPVWKKLGRPVAVGDFQYLFVSTDGYWTIGPSLTSNVAYVYLPENDPTPKSPINTQGWFHAEGRDPGWKRDDTIKVEVFTGGYEINSFGGVAEQYPNLMGRYRLTSTIANNFPVYECKENGLYIYVDPFENWAVGDDWETEEDAAWIYHLDIDPTPWKPPSEGWFFENDDDHDPWQSDPTLTFQYIRDI